MISSTTTVMEPPRYRIVKLERRANDSPCKCARCNRNILYAYYIVDSTISQSEDDTLIVGSECVKIMTGKTVKQIEKENTEYQAHQQRSREYYERTVMIEKWKLANNDIISTLEDLAEGMVHYLPVAHDFLDRIYKFGTLSEKQMFVAQRCVAKRDRYLSKDAYQRVLDYMLDNLHVFDYTITDNMNVTDQKTQDHTLIKDILSQVGDWGMTKAQAGLVVDVYEKYGVKYHYQSDATQVPVQV